MISPHRPGTEIQLTVKVTNNKNDTCDVSINKHAMGEVESWVSIKDNNKLARPTIPVEFKLTIKIPDDAEDRDYYLPLYFNAYDHNNHNTSYSFNYFQQIIIVDNSKPASPSFKTSSTSYTITVKNWYSTDARSAEYTDINQSTGINGIEKYKILLKDKSGSTLKSKTYEATGNQAHKFDQLAAATKYIVEVVAVDLAGNSNNHSEQIYTKPGKPKNLRFSDTTYTRVILRWDTAEGATWYNVYLMQNETLINEQLNNSPITNTYFPIGELIPEQSYMFSVTAVNSSGEGDRSNVISIIMPAFPRIVGTSLLCSGNYTYFLESLRPGYSLYWSSSSNLHKVSVSGLSSIFQVNGTKEGWIKAMIVNNLYGDTNFLQQKDVWLGVPDNKRLVTGITSPPAGPLAQVHELCDQGITVASVGYDEDGLGIYGTSGSNYYIFQEYEWLVLSSNWLITDTWQGRPMEIVNIQPDWGFEPWPGDYEVIKVRGRNDCGWSGWHSDTWTVVNCGGWSFSMQPNPASDYVVLKVLDKEEKTLNKTFEVKILTSQNKVVFLSGKKNDPSLTIPLYNLRNGIYFIRITVGKETVTKQLVVKH